MRVRTEGGFNKAQERYDGIVSLVVEKHFDTPEEYENWRDEAIASMELLADIDLDDFDALEETHATELGNLKTQKEKEVAGLIKELEAKNGEFQKEREMLTKRIRKLEGQLSKEKTTTGGK